MTWRRVAWLPVMVALFACAEGGIRGSGISTSVLGNVVSVQAAARSGAPERTDVEGIRVAIEGTDIQGETEADGSFSLRGDFEGLVSLVFVLPGGGGEARIGLNVPAAGLLTLNNVHIDARQGTAVAETAEVDFDGVVTATDCAGGTLTMESLHHTPDDVDQYTVRLDTSTLQDTRGNAVPCSEVDEGERASVRGAVDPDGSFGEATIVLQD